ncbi:hypothetical protein WSK_3828 [Novosphingobium sp. Rr 2-17]|uniref:hypothetical protein n=1 Tax=Novosphingobium sp. Rr 2-17 TaxID=555793 RepID=UPI000269890C|nr:hypothetical protein [Novosphingobium sp. Rr 2-17]EIZ77592.1 hypothetical protein WSK_3828 [Novosphingobium sp. Rr 2-17]
MEISATALTRISRAMLTLGVVEQVPDIEAHGRGRLVAKRLHGADLITTVEGRRPRVGVSNLSASPITLGAALLPIHALSAQS